MSSVVIPIPEEADGDLLRLVPTLKKMDTPCKTNSHRWWTDRFSIAHRIDEEQAKAACQGCGARSMCLAWAFDMEEYHVWGGFTASERHKLRALRPELVEELKMLIKALINTADGRGGKLKPGTVRDVPDEHGAALVRRGLAERVTEIVAELDGVAKSLRAIEGTEATTESEPVGHPLPYDPDRPEQTYDPDTGYAYAEPRPDSFTVEHSEELPAGFPHLPVGKLDA